MYAVIKTGGKQYRVRPGDMLVVEKLAGEAGAEVAFDQVLMVGEGEAVTVGAPLVEGAVVKATLVETRKGEKIKIFKKIRRQGYRRTGGHRQFESVLRVTSVAGGGQTESWDGTVDLTPLAVLNARARNLKTLAESLVASSSLLPVAEKAAPAKKAPANKAATTAQAEQAPAVEAPVEATPAPQAKAAPAKKAPAKTAEAAPAEAKAKTEAPAKKPAPKAAEAKAEAKTDKAPAKKAPAKKSPAAKSGKAE